MTGIGSSDISVIRDRALETNFGTSSSGIVRRSFKSAPKNNNYNHNNYFLSLLKTSLFLEQRSLSFLPFIMSYFSTSFLLSLSFYSPAQNVPGTSLFTITVLTLLLCFTASMCSSNYDNQPQHDDIKNRRGLTIPVS